MIKLDYRTNNFRWGRRGIVFSDWTDFAFVLGFLTNINHYRNHIGSSIWNNSISIVKEQNNQQGAWSFENRILYFGDFENLKQDLNTLSIASSAGNTGITARINSNNYINDLIREFHFTEQPQNGNTTINIFPPNIPQQDFVSLLKEKLSLSQVDNIQECVNKFFEGYNL